MGHVDGKGMPNLLQMSLIGREFSDPVQFNSPPPAVQKVVFATLAPLADPGLRLDRPISSSDGSIRVARKHADRTAVPSTPPASR